MKVFALPTWVLIGLMSVFLTTASISSFAEEVGESAPELGDSSPALSPAEDDVSFSEPPGIETPPELFTDIYRDDLFALLQTSVGKMKFQLMGRDSPENVKNFINLARGAKEYIDLTGARQFSKFYNGLTFHKVLHNFVVQGGCPKGNGTGGPGFNLQTEINPRLRLDVPGVMAVANYGPDTNGSQFFITTGESPSLQGNYTVLGTLTEGMDTLQKINRTAVDGLARPTFPIVIERIEIYAGEEQI